MKPLVHTLQIVELTSTLVLIVVAERKRVMRTKDVTGIEDLDGYNLQRSQKVKEYNIF